MLYTKLKYRITEIKELVKLGVVAPHWLTRIEIFEEYQRMEEELPCKVCRCDHLAHRYGYKSERTIEKIIYMFSN